jgi:hypothetical protein
MTAHLWALPHLRAQTRTSPYWSTQLQLKDQFTKEGAVLLRALEQVSVAALLLRTAAAIFSPFMVLFLHSAFYTPQCM